MPSDISEGNEIVTSALIQTLENHATNVDFPRGSLLFRLNEPCVGVYVVRRGKISLRWAKNSNVYPMETAGPGSLVGLPAALNGSYSATARAVEDSALGFIPVDIVNYLLDCNPSLCRSAMELIAHEVRRMRLLITEAASFEASDGRHPTG